jgi:hypothetical protein
MYKRILVIILSLVPFFAFSQKAKNIHIKGKVVDAKEQKGLFMASISVRKSADSSLVTFGFSNEKGEFSTPAIESGVSYRLILAYTGYEIIKKDFILSAEEDNYDLGIFKLETSARTLDEMVISAERPPVIMRHDTIEFNASSFKTLPNAIVEDLLKKLPGVNLEEDGSLTYNGRKVNKLLVDGKEFFGSDPRVAMQNLPAQVVDKIQVSEDKNEARFNPQMNASEIGQVINLTLKKGMNKGYFGKLYAGAGAGDQFQYESGGIVNFFRDTFQLSIIGFSNNINKQSFNYNEINDLAGFGRSGTRSYSYSNTDGLSINNFNVGGATQGLNRNSGGGINLNHIIGKGNFNFQYFINESKSDLTGNTATTQFLVDSVFKKSSEYGTLTNSLSHSIGVSYRVILDTLTNYSISANGSFRESDRDFFSAQQNGSTYNILSRGQVDQKENNSTPSWNANGRFVRKAKRSKNVFSTNGGVSFSDFNGKVFAQSNSFLGASLLPFFTTDQNRNSQNRNLEMKVGVQYDWFIRDSFYLTFENNSTQQFALNAVNTYFKNPEGKYESYQLLLSNGTDMNVFQNSTGVEATYLYKKLKFNAGAELMKYNMDATFATADTTINQNFTKILPSARISRKNTSLRYNMNFEPVQATNLNPVINNSNGLTISSGNLALQPAIAHRFTLHGYDFNPKKNTYANIWSSYDYKTNSVISSQEIDSQGVLTNKPINLKSQQSLYLSGSFRKSYKNKANYKFTYSIFGNISYGERPVQVNGTIQNYQTFSSGPRTSISFNYKDKFDLTQEYGYNPILNINQKKEQLFSYRHNSTTAFLLRWPKKFTFKTSYSYNYNQLPTSSSNSKVIYSLWNAEVFYSFMKNDKAIISLMVYDILGQNTNINTYSSDNIISVSQTNILQRYFMVSLTYNLKDFKGEKPGESKNRMYWWW